MLADVISDGKIASTQEFRITQTCIIFGIFIFSYIAQCYDNGREDNKMRLASQVHEAYGNNVLKVSMA